MKKIIILVISMLILSSCSVQEKMNTEIFIERFLKNKTEYNCQNTKTFYEDNSCKIFIKNKNETEFLIILYFDENSNIHKITLTSESTRQDFISIAEDIIKIYSVDDSADEILKELFKNEFDYFETQWYYYTSALNANIIFFSIENKKLTVPKNIEFTLKPNDIDITKGSD